MSSPNTVCIARQAEPVSRFIGQKLTYIFRPNRVKTRIKQNLDKASDSGRESKVVMNGVKATYYS